MMVSGWQPLPGADLQNPPRRLTEQELQSIIDSFPDVRGADRMAAEQARKNITTWIRTTLSKLEICPPAIPALIKRIYDAHIRSMVAPGTPIGIAAAEAVGATTTQMTLNSVHPHEDIFIQYSNGRVYHGPIGSWIDNLIKDNAIQVRLIPENRTEYLPLSEAVYILSPDQSGKVSWSLITAVTRHLPVGDLVKVTLPHGQSVRVTQSKSLLLWNGEQLVQEPGSAAKVGNMLPLIKNIPAPEIEISHLKFGDLEFECNATLGLIMGMYIAYGQIIRDTIYLPITKSSSYYDEIMSWLCLHSIILSTKLLISVKSLKLVRFFKVACGICQRYIPDDLLCASEQTLKGFIAGVTEKGDKKIFENLCNQDLKLANQFSIIFCRLGINNYTWQVQSQVYLVPCSEVITVPASAYVYDLTVPSTTNFCLANGIGVADTFHTSGSSKSATSGIEAMRDLVLARQNPKNEQSTIYFLNKNMSYAEVLNTRSFIVGSTFSDFIMDYRIDKLENLSQEWWLPYWSTILQQTSQDTMILHLELNLSEMYKHRVSLRTLQNAILNDKDRSVEVFYGPISTASLYIIPLRQFIWNSLQIAALSDRVSVELAEITFLDTIVMPKLQTLSVKGVKGIRNLSPKVSKIWELVLQEVPLVLDQVTNPQALTILHNAAQTGKLWRLFLNKIHMLDTGLTIDNLNRLLTAANITIILVTSDQVAVSVPHKWNNIPPSEVLKQKLLQDNDEINKQVKIEVDRNIAASKDPSLSPEQRRDLILRIPQVAPSPLIYASEYVIAEADGCNLMELLALPYVDKTRTLCSNMHSIAKALGIEAARSFIIKSLLQIISRNSDVHPAHIIFIAEFLTSRGQPLGATHTGISRQPVGHLTLSTVSQSMKVLANSALAGKSENVRNVSSAIMLGSRTALGTGYFDIAQDVTIQGVEQTLVNDQVVSVYIYADKPDPILPTPTGDLLAGLDNLLSDLPVIQSTADNPANPLQLDFNPQVIAGLPVIGPVSRSTLNLVTTPITTTALVVQDLPTIDKFTDMPPIVQKLNLDQLILEVLPQLQDEEQLDAEQLDAERRQLEQMQDTIVETEINLVDPNTLLQYFQNPQ